MIQDRQDYRVKTTKIKMNDNFWNFISLRLNYVMLNRFSINADLKVNLKKKKGD